MDLASLAWSFEGQGDLRDQDGKVSRGPKRSSHGAMRTNDPRGRETDDVISFAPGARKEQKERRSGAPLLDTGHRFIEGVPKGPDASTEARMAAGGDGYPAAGLLGCSHGRGAACAGAGTRPAPEGRRGANRPNSRSRAWRSVTAYVSGAGTAFRRNSIVRSYLS
jgi:hypothetical protein